MTFTVTISVKKLMGVDICPSICVLERLLKPGGMARWRGSAGHVRMTTTQGKDLISASVFQVCCATTGHLGTKANKQEGKVDWDGERDRQEQTEGWRKRKNVSKMVRWKAFFCFCALLVWAKRLYFQTCHTEKWANAQTQGPFIATL